MTDTVKLNFGGQRLLVEYDYTPGTPDVYYLSNGDPGYPGDPEEFYVTGVKMQGPDKSWINIGELAEALTGDQGGDDALTVATYKAVQEERENYDPT
jgi:hypothetical protein